MSGIGCRAAARSTRDDERTGEVQVPARFSLRTGCVLAKLEPAVVDAPMLIARAGKPMDGGGALTSVGRYSKYASTRATLEEVGLKLNSSELRSGRVGCRSESDRRIIANAGNHGGEGLDRPCLNVPRLTVAAQGAGCLSRAAREGLLETTQDALTEGTRSIRCSYRTPCSGHAQHHR